MFAVCVLSVRAVFLQVKKKTSGSQTWQPHYKFRTFEMLCESVHPATEATISTLYIYVSTPVQ